MIRFTLDTNPLKKQLTAIEKDQLPFAVSLAINRTTLLAQAEVRKSLGQHFTINPGRQKFMEMMVRFDRTMWATKTKLDARFGVNDSEGPSFGKDRSFILGRHETGGLRAASPDRPFAIPDKSIRQGPYDLPPRNMYPTALGITSARYSIEPRKVSRVKNRKGQGKRSYFVIRDPSNPKVWGIFERFGTTTYSFGKDASGRLTRGTHDQIRPVWWFRTSIKLPPRLRFYETSTRVFSQNWVAEWEKAMAEAMRTAR